MIDTQAMIDEFCELVRIDSPSLEEAEVNAFIRERLAEIGIESRDDGAGERVGGNAGNIIAHVPGTVAAPAVMLNAHTDTVQPGRGIKPQIEGTIIRSDGTTILGGDDKCGVAIILATLRELLDGDLPRPPLDVVFTVYEEGGLHGAQQLDYDDISAETGYVLDGGRTMGVITNAAPSAFALNWQVKGVAAHAGVCPERGVNSIRAAAEAIAAMPLGRLDDETTANIGIIEGGAATNIVPELTVVRGEARSHNEEKLQAQVDLMVAGFEAAAESVGAQVEADVQRSYTSFRIEREAPALDYAWRAAESLGFAPRLETGGGGSDANIFNERGIESIIVATGPAEVHTVNEWVDGERMAESARWMIETLGVAAGDAS